MLAGSNRSLRAAVLAATSQDLRKCSHCATCALRSGPDMDVSLEGLVQLAVMNDEEVLTSRTLWSERALAAAEHVCGSGLDLPEVMRALRLEAERRGVKPE